MMHVTKEDLQQAAQGATELSAQSREHPENEKLNRAASEAWDRYMHLTELFHGVASEEVADE